GGTGRIAACWYNGGGFSIDINLTDGQPHRVAAYLLDWDSNGRSETIRVVDAVSGALLDSRSASAFHDGDYLVWTMSGHVRLDISYIAGINPVVSGLFFGPAGGSATAPTITSQPASTTVSAGQTATFSVTATGNPTPTFQWQKNSVAI